MTTTSSNSTSHSEEATSFNETNSSLHVWSTASNQHLGIHKRSFWSSLRFKTTLLAIGIGTLPVLLIGTVGYLFAGEVIEEQVEQREQANAELLADKVSRFMFERYGDIQVLAQQPIFTNAQLRSNTTVAEKEQFLNSYIKAFDTVYGSIALLDKNGNDIAVSNGAAHSNHKNDDYFREVMTTGRPIITQPRVSNSTKTEQVYVAAPVKDSDTDQIIGVIRTRIPTAAIEELLEDFEAVGELHFADASGRIFLSTEVSETKADDDLETLDELEDTTQDDEAESEEEASAHLGETADDLFPELAEFRQNATSGSLRTVDALDGEEELLGYAAVPALGRLPDLGWFVLVETEIEEAFEAQASLGRSFFWGTLLSMITIGVAAIMITNRGIKPIEAAAAAVEQFGQGNFAERLNIKGADEVTILGNNLNRMADQIQELLRTLRSNAKQLKQHNSVLSNLARNDALIQGRTKDAARTFTEVIAHTLEVERVSVWLYTPDRSQITCLNLYERTTNQHSDGLKLHVKDFPKYFDAILQDGLIAAEDVQRDPRTSEMAASYLIPLNIVSMLDFPIQIAGRTVGVLCCEQVETRRKWKPEEQTFIYSIASLISLALESETLQGEVGHLLDVVSAVEEGNLTVHAQVSDRTTGLVSDIFNRLIERFADVLNQVLEAARQVSQGANQQKALAGTVATNAQQQAESATEVLHLTEQAEYAAQDSAERVNTASQSLRTVSSTVVLGQDAIAAMTEGIQVLQEGTDRIIQRMKTLGEFVGLADQFVQDQGQIAFITQTLALNASLVAARASEQRDPRQFIVVAQEFNSIADQVSKLAQQTNEGLVTLEQRSAQIHSAVSGIDADVQSLGELVRGFTQGVEQSNQVFSNVQIITDEAVQAGEVVAQYSQNIVEAVQTTAKVMREIAELAAQTAALTQTSQQQSDRIDALSTQLLQSVQFFRLPEADLQLGAVERIDLSRAEATTVEV
jgi:methyl-accepting chemotaxis protein PixJ